MAGRRYNQGYVPPSLNTDQLLQLDNYPSISQLNTHASATTITDFRLVQQSTVVPQVIPFDRNERLLQQQFSHQAQQVSSINGNNRVGLAFQHQMQQQNYVGRRQCSESIAQTNMIHQRTTTMPSLATQTSNLGSRLQPNGYHQNSGAGSARENIFADVGFPRNNYLPSNTVESVNAKRTGQSVSHQQSGFPSNQQAAQMFGSASTSNSSYNQTSPTLSTPTAQSNQQMLVDKLRADYNVAARRGTEHALMWISNYIKHKRNVEMLQKKKSDEEHCKIYGQIFNVPMNNDEQNTENVTWNWYKLPGDTEKGSSKDIDTSTDSSFEKENSKNFDTSKNDTVEMADNEDMDTSTYSTTTVEDNGRGMNTSANSNISFDGKESNADTFEISGFDEETLSSVARQDSTDTPDNPDTRKNTDSPSSSNNVESVNVTSSRRNDEVASPLNESDTENSQEKDEALQTPKLSNDGNISYFYEVMSLQSARFTIYFHGQKMLCITKGKGKYVVLRELLFYFFKKKIPLIKSLIHRLGIRKLLLTGKEKKGVCKYLNEKGVFSKSSTSNVGVVHIEHANRLYHKVFLQRKCDICVKLGDINLCTPSPPAVVSIIEIDSDTEDMATSTAGAEEMLLSVKTECPDMVAESKSEMSSTPVLNEIDYDSDATLPYDDDENIQEQPMPVLGEEDGTCYGDELVLSGGLMQQDCSIIRFIKNDQTNFLPVKDIIKMFSKEIIKKTMTMRNLHGRLASCLQACYLTKLSSDLEEIREGDILVDADILDHIYNVASCLQTKMDVEGIHQRNIADDQGKDGWHHKELAESDGNRYRAMVQKMKKYVKSTLEKQPLKNYTKRNIENG